MTDNSYLNEYYDYINTHKLTNTNDNNIIFHRHHIIPQCIGGLNDESNIVCLIPKDHAKAHELLYKAYHACAIELAHALVSIIGKDNCSSDVLTDDVLDQYNVQMTDACRLAKLHKGNNAKRTIYRLSDLSTRRIFKNETLPNGYVECPQVRNAWIFNKDYVKKMWDKNNVPVGWKLISEATADEFAKVFPNAGNNGMKGSIWIYNPTTNERKMIKKGQLIPDGWKHGVKLSDDAILRQTAGGLKSKDKLDQIKLKYGGIRWVHDITTHKNKMIGKSQQLPQGYAEGMFDKRIYELQKKLNDMSNISR